jgi:hypothetical protein
MFECGINAILNASEMNWITEPRRNLQAIYLVNFQSSKSRLGAALLTDRKNVALSLLSIYRPGFVWAGS